MARPSVLPGQRPDWLKIRIPAPEVVDEVAALMRGKKLVTVCEEARCPNLNECWGVHRTATFMLMGDICTRHCGFCSVGKGKPGELDPEEPQRVAEAVASLSLKFAVVTSVNRDDLPDGGAAHFAKTIHWIHSLNEGCGVEVLIPDFRGHEEALNTVLAARPEVLNHTVETVPHLSQRVRPDADYGHSMTPPRRAAMPDSSQPGLRTKSGMWWALGCGTGAGVDDGLARGQRGPPTLGNACHRPVHISLQRCGSANYMCATEGPGRLPARVESGPLVRAVITES